MFIIYIPKNASLSNINLSSLICHVTSTLLSFNTIFNFFKLYNNLTILLVYPFLLFLSITLLNTGTAFVTLYLK